MKKHHEKHAKTLKHQRIQNLLEQAELCATKHDAFGLFGIIKKCSPKTVHRPIRLKTHTGLLANLPDEIQMYHDYIADRWSGPELPQLDLELAPGIPFDESELEAVLRRIPLRKATAQPFAAGIAFAQNSQIIAAKVFQELQVWWTTLPIYVPPEWRHGWLVMMPKPNKTASCLGNLRPLCLQEPVGKAVAKLVSQKRTPFLAPQLQRYPQFAYQHSRSVLDAIRRVSEHCTQVRMALDTNKSTVWTGATRADRLKLAGGIQIFLDLNKAFDSIPRAWLMSRLLSAGIPWNLVAIIHAWHQDTHYLHQRMGQWHSSPVHSGV